MKFWIAFVLNCLPGAADACLGLGRVCLRPPFPLFGASGVKGGCGYFPPGAELSFALMVLLFALTGGNMHSLRPAFCAKK